METLLGMVLFFIFIFAMILIATLVDGDKINKNVVLKATLYAVLFTAAFSIVFMITNMIN